jgi:hypothetical protein
MNVISKAPRTTGTGYAAGRDRVAALPVYRTVYRFGAIDSGHFGYIVLGEDGVVKYYKQPPDAPFRFDGTMLRFTDDAGHETVRLRYFPDANCFMADDRSRFYLLPVLERDETVPVHGFGPPVMINSIPKSGTYFLEAVLRHLGGVPFRVHLLSHICDDYRDTPESEMHRNPPMHRVAVPGGAVAHLLRPGDVAVGHVLEAAELDEISRAGVRMLHCVRDLRGVLVSYFRFKKAKVAPICDEDVAWRALDDEAGFLQFLNFAAPRDIVLVAKMAEMIVTRKEPVLKFEDALRGHVPADVAQLLGGEEFAQALRVMRDKPTSTYSGGTVHYGQYWSEAAEVFFQSSGLAALNRQLGYLV